MAKTKRPNEGAGLSGEGHLIDAELIGDGRAHFDLAQVPAPTQRFVAHAAGFLQQEGDFRLFFIQNTLRGIPRSLIDIFVPGPAWENFLSSLDAFPEVPDFASKLAEAPDKEPTESLSVAASFVRASVGENGGVFDFLYSSPFSMSYFNARKSGLYVDSVIRVQLPAALGFALVAAAKSRGSAT